MKRHYSVRIYRALDGFDEDFLRTRCGLIRGALNVRATNEWKKVTCLTCRRSMK